MPFSVFEDSEECFNCQDCSLFNISKSAFKADRTYDIGLADLFSASHDPVFSEETGE
jgi:hypothetical protein